MPTLQLSDQDKTELLQRLPPVDLSYAPFPPHKKVLGNLYLAIPRGLKCLLWFTYWREQNICVILPLNERGNIVIAKMYVTAACFAAPLSKGTLFYGTMFTHHPSPHKQRCFSIENINWYMGHDMSRLIWREKLALLQELFGAYLMQKAYTTDFIVVGLPVLAPTLQELQTRVAELPYECFGFDIFHSDLREKVGFVKLRPMTATGNLTAIFAVKALADQDMYSLSLEENSVHGFAAVPTFQDSVMLNRLFRHVRENDNLDLLEESEDEEEMASGFSINPEQVVRMRCVYMPRFGKWKPVEVVGADVALTPVHDVRLVEVKKC